MQTKIKKVKILKATPEAVPLLVLAKQTKDSKTILKASSLLFSKAKRPVKPLELAIVGAALFQYFTKQKNVEIFAISMQNLEYQLNKAEKSITDLAIVIPECYHNFLNVFSKKVLDKILFHSKYNHKIKFLKSGKDYGHAVFQGMSKTQLKFVNKFLEEHFKKSFIKTNKASSSSLILLAKKLGDGVKFCCYEPR